MTRKSGDFVRGQWVHIDDQFNHKYAGFDGEILEIKGKSAIVQIYNIDLGEENGICLVPFRCTIPKRKLTLLPNMNSKIYFSMFRQTIDDVKNLMNNGGMLYLTIEERDRTDQ